MNDDQERLAIRAAMDRLLAGQSLRTAGALTIVGLAQEADVKRHVLTHRHIDLKDEFYARVHAQNHVSPQLAAAHDQNDALQRRLNVALEDNRRLTEQVRALARQLNLLVAEHNATQQPSSANSSWSGCTSERGPGTPRHCSGISC